MHTGVPIADEYQTFRGDKQVGRLGIEPNIGPRVDQLFRCRWCPIRDFLRRELVLDVENTHSGIVVRREDGVFALQ